MTARVVREAARRDMMARGGRHARRPSGALLRPTAWLLALLPACALDATPQDVVPEPADTAPDTPKERPDELVQVDTDHGPRPPQSDMVLSLPVRCARPEERETHGPFRRLTTPEDPQGLQWFTGAGFAVGDYDQDGQLDWFLAGDRASRLFTLAPAGILEQRDPFGDIDLSSASGAVAVDIEGDGDLDLYVTRYQRPNVLLRNDGGAWVDDTAARGLAGDPTARSIGASFADVDLDGDLDLFVANYGPIDTTGLAAALWGDGDRNQVFENVGGGVFVEHSDALVGPGSTGYTFLGGWFDMDDDGVWELYVVNDFGEAFGANALLHFDNWLSLLPDRNARGLDLITHGMGLALGDLNEDGQYDILVSAWARHHLLTSYQGLWFDATASTGIDRWDSTESRVAWGNSLGDLDNDGDLDAFVTFGRVELQGRWANPIRQPDLLFINQDGTFELSADGMGLVDDYAKRAVGLVDLDRDGYLDMLKPALDDADATYLSRCGTAAWLQIAVRTPDENTHGIGARIKVRDGGRQWMQTIRAGGDPFASGLPPLVHFGLGDRETVDEIEVRFPDGSVETWQDVPTRRFVQITQRRP